MFITISVACRKQVSKKQSVITQSNKIVSMKIEYFSYDIKPKILRGDTFTWNRTQGNCRALVDSFITVERTGRGPAWIEYVLVVQHHKYKYNKGFTKRYKTIRWAEQPSDSV